jgi:transcriptional regulator with GAF, ATPase, and Fis domain
MSNHRALRSGGAPLRSSISVSAASNQHPAHFDPDARPGSTTSRRFVFQRLVADLAARFAVTRADAIDRTVTDSLADIGEALELDCLVLWRHDVRHADSERAERQTNATEGVLAVTHRWPNGDPASAGDSWSTTSTPFMTSRLERGQAVWFTRVEELGDPVDRETFRRNGLRSAAVVPLAAAGRTEGVRRSLLCGSTSRHVEWPSAVVQQLRLVSGIFSQALLRKASDTKLQQALSELQELRDRAADDDLRRPALAPDRPPRRIIANSAPMAEVFALADQVAPTPATVLLLGETGVGKEVFAEAIHELSPRRQRQMVRVNCAAMPTALIESALFGHERGAFTDALARQIGRFEAANHSTLFLDEIGDLPGHVQVKLLRVLQERVIERLGSPQSVKVDVRIIAATNRSLEQGVADGTFREDLYYRLNVFPIAIPPLRDRVEDIPGLVWEFVDEFSQAFGKPIESVSKESMKQLQEHPWPGNVRELRNIIERAVIVATGPRLVVPVPAPTASPPRGRRIVS